MTDTEIVEVMARAIKSALGKAMNAQPLLGDTTKDDWYATGCSIDLSDLAKTVQTALTANGYVIVPFEPTLKQIHAGMDASGKLDFAHIYRAMIEATKKPHGEPQG